MLAQDLTDRGVQPHRRPAVPPARKSAPTWAEARQLAFNCATPIPPVRVPLSEAIGRTLVHAVISRHDLPHFASSAMDGWAVSGSGPWILAVPCQRLAPHHASPIVTGGLVPSGAEAVLRSESVRITEDGAGRALLTLGSGAKPGEPRSGQHIRNAARKPRQAKC